MNTKITSENSDLQPWSNPTKFLTSWTLASVLGWLIGGNLGAGLSSSLPAQTSGAIAVAAGAFLACSFQGWALQPYKISWLGWISSPAITTLLIGVASYFVKEFDLGLGVAIGGTVLGSIQWLLLKKRMTHSGWWIVASTLGWILGGFLSGGVHPMIGWAVIGTVYGIITSLCLLKLLGLESTR